MKIKENQVLMGIKAAVVKRVAGWVVPGLRLSREESLAAQKALFNHLIHFGRLTRFGEDHAFKKIKNYEDFKERVPVRDYEKLKFFFDRLLAGEKDLFWPGRPLYLAKTSGTTSGVKYIPLTEDSAPTHVKAARNAVFCRIHETGNARVMDGRLMFLSGSPKLKKKFGMYVGRLSGIVNHMVPFWLKTHQVPSWNTNCIEDWEKKVERIVEETARVDLRLISGIPPWVQMYFEKLLDYTGKSRVCDVFPNLEYFVYGGVNFEPYRNKLLNMVGRPLETIETYPASEGFFAFQDLKQDEGLLLQTNSGIFYEFIPLEQHGQPDAPRLTLENVEVGRQYAMVVSSNAGLWAYDLGDTVRFTSLDPFRIRVTGRTKHFISAFGEHVIAEEVDFAMKQAADKTRAEVIEFHVAPQVNPESGLPYHEWFVEFDTPPENLEFFSTCLDTALQERNIYYRDLVTGRTIRPAVVTVCPKGTFVRLMKSQDKLGGQNKVPRLANQRHFAEAIEAAMKG
ncbi:MAG: GH3 auxin-responsive promoter family protein [Flavobacteriales bacterium]|nr:GH3 auxin-responsive promoter family protein [Flavobacteriales bacterium]MDW8431716.1 GH3 auxin-responsive promoter family protein [Flavobacteriales bacterium]